MKTVYVAMDGTLFQNKGECENYEREHFLSKNFTIKYILSFDDEKIIEYTGNGKGFDLTEFICCVVAFKIVDGMDNWNKFVDNEFSIVDSDIYEHYDPPMICGKDKEYYSNEWWCYGIDDRLVLFEHGIVKAERYLENMKTLHKKLLNS